MIFKINLNFNNCRHDILIHVNGHKYEQTPEHSEGQSGVLQHMRSQRVRHHLANGQQQHSSSTTDSAIPNCLTLNTYIHLNRSRRHLCLRAPQNGYFLFHPQVILKFF